METRLIDSLKKKQESPLRDIYSKEELLPGIIQNLSEYIWLAVIREKKLSILYHSPSINRLTGYSPEELKTSPRLWIPSGPAAESKKLEEAIRQVESDRTFEIKLSHPVLLRGGKRIWVETHLKSHDALGEPCCLCVSRHFSKMEGEILKLKKARESAESASKAKSEFLAAKSHEIRTPLSILLGLIELLRDTMLTRKQEKYLGIMNSCSEILLSLLNNIIDISKIESGRMELEEESFSLNRMIESVSDIFGPQASEKSIDIFFFIDPALPFYSYGDPVRLRQVILNLLGNAVKFTERGTVKISVRAETPCNSSETSPGRLMVRFSVSDTGPGIRGTDQKRIFYNFTQASRNKTSKHTGAGMGLNISKGLVEMMGGKIWVESKLNSGTTFHFTVPLGHAEKSEKKFSHSLSQSVKLSKKRLPSPKGARILLVDDNPESSLITESLLVKAGYLVDITSNGKEAVTAVQNHIYSLVIIDMNMPVMDGFEATGKIRAIENCPDRVPVIALSAYALAEFKKKAFKTGVDDYLTKPVKSKTLLEKVEKWIDNRNPEKSTPENRSSVYEPPELDDLKLRFIVNRRADLKTIKILQEKESYTEIERIGHDIKGLGYAFGYHRISRVGEALEQAASICNSREISRQAKILARIISEEEGCYSDDEPNKSSPLLLSK